ncbi:MAG: S10 family peptidase [Vicinamibacterales bacterium]
MIRHKDTAVLVLLAAMALAVGFVFTLPVSAQAPGATTATQATSRQPSLEADQKNPAEPRELEEKTSVTKHTVRIGGQAVPYTATAGTLILRDDSGKPMASFFYVYYARDNVTDLGRRPMLYSFNGGPGTASVWMHMGFTGPRRVVYDENGFMVQPPFRFADNEHSIIDVADIVYVDPVGTGYSRMAPGEDPHKFHGLMEDIQSVGDFIRVFTIRYGRWKSPKFLIGESYGTTRASGLASYLQTTHQMYLNGVILVSMTNLGMTSGDDTGFATRLPHMTATAWYHKALSGDLQAKPLAEVLAEAERFALGDYLVALAKGGLLPAPERTSIARQMARLTGLSETYVLQSNLRVDIGRFRKELLRGRGLTVGRLDSRYTGVDRDAAGEANEFDPAMAHWDGPFANALADYLRDELDWKSEDKYYVWGNVRPWRSDPNTRVGEMLRRAMTQNPYLKVLVLAAYYDGGTDYFSAQYTMSHIDPSGAVSKRIQFAFYESGHMMYLRNADLAKAKKDVSTFISSSTPRGTN